MVALPRNPLTYVAGAAGLQDFEFTIRDGMFLLYSETQKGDLRFTWQVFPHESYHPRDISDKKWNLEYCIELAKAQKLNLNSAIFDDSVMFKQVELDILPNYLRLLFETSRYAIHSSIDVFCENSEYFVELLRNEHNFVARMQYRNNITDSTRFDTLSANDFFESAMKHF